MTEKELYELRNIFLQLGKLVQKYGENYYNIQINSLEDMKILKSKLFLIL